MRFEKKNMTTWPRCLQFTVIVGMLIIFQSSAQQLQTFQNATNTVTNTTYDTITAFTATFIRRDGATIQSVNARAVQWVLNLMDKQDIPKSASAMRNLNDSQLIAIGMRAAMAGISSWRREPTTDRIVLNDNTGYAWGCFLMHV